jgi:hypothetical protein
VSGRRLVIAGLATLAAAGCVAPAPTVSAYEGKAAKTAQAALSAVETARLAAETATAGKLPGPTLETVLTESEDAYSSVQQTFDSVEPPDDPRADQIRTALDELLTAGAAGLQQLRIQARRGQRDRLAATARSLADPAAGLARFERQHSG